MKPHEEIAELKKQVNTLEEQNKGLVKRIAELEAAKPKSKSRQQAEAALELLKQGPVTVAQLKPLNDKYPSDAYHVRNLLKLDVKTVRTATGSVYMLPEHFAIYQAGQEKQKAQEKAAAAEAKEEVSPATPIPQSPQTRTTGAALAV